MMIDIYMFNTLVLHVWSHFEETMNTVGWKATMAGFEQFTMKGFKSNCGSDEVGTINDNDSVECDSCKMGKGVAFHRVNISSFCHKCLHIIKN